MITKADAQDRRIVVGVDGSHGSRTALRWALIQARLTGATVEAVAAWQSPAMIGYSYGWVPLPYEGESIAAGTERVLAEPSPTSPELRTGPARRSPKGRPRKFYST